MQAEEGKEDRWEGKREEREKGKKIWQSGGYMGEFDDLASQAGGRKGLPLGLTPTPRDTDEPDGQFEGEGGGEG